MTSETEKRCSAVCTRSGMAALVLAAVALALLPIIDDAIRTNSLRSYYSLRFALAESLRQMASDPCWKRLSEETPMISLTLSQASQLECFEKSGPAGSTYIIEEKEPPVGAPERLPPPLASAPISHPRTEPKAGPPDTTPPSAPRMLAIEIKYDLPHIEQLQSVLSQLARASLLRHAREVSTRYDYAIYRWEDFRWKTLIRRYQAIGVHRFSGPRGDSQHDFSWADFTIGDISEVASFELPTDDAIDKIEREKLRISIPSVPIPMELRTGASLLLGAMLLVVVFFWLYHKEAMRTETYPSSGTLYGIFHNQSAGYLLFMGLVLIPPISASLLVIKLWSRFALVGSIVNALIALLVATVSLDIARHFISIRKGNKDS